MDDFEDRTSDRQRGCFVLIAVAFAWAAVIGYAAAGIW